MNISFQTVTGQKMDGNPVLNGMDAIYSSKSETGKSLQTGGLYVATLDTSFFSNDVYGHQGKSAEDVANKAQDMDVETQKKYMILLSNTLSKEDYAKAAEDGFDIKNIDSRETVTIVDKIKSVLLESGNVITGYNDDLSTDKLARITGSQAFAEAISKSFNENDIPVTAENVRSAKLAYENVSDVEKLDDSAVKYMVLNNMAPTIDNVYLANHSSNGQNVSGRGFYAQDAGGYYAQKADECDFEQLDPQISRIIAQAGMDSSDEEIKEEARWIVRQGIALTSENLQKAHDIFSIEFPVDEDRAVKAIVCAMADGKNPGEANLSDLENSFSKAVRIKKDTDTITEENIKEVIQSEKVLNLRNLWQSAGTAIKLTTPQQEEKFAIARLQVEQVRLQMTVEANRQLINSGFSIDTAPMEELIERLKNLVGQVSDEETGAAIETIKSGPIGVTGAMLASLETASLAEISSTSKKLSIEYKKAFGEYETMMTKPRADLGDKISKAFRNVDDILKDLEFETNEENRRAVRILGYNSMEIDKENIEQVRSWDQMLKATLERLKPGAVLELIRDGKNPLGMTIEELSQSLDEKDTKDENGRSGNNNSDEKYSKFLYKLEKKKEITAEEKTSYIGIYRLFHTLKENDYQAIGSVLKTGLSMTLGNLLKATRTKSASRKGMDYSVDEDFGGLDIRAASGGLKIDEQINTAFRYYSSKADIVYENLEPEKLMAAAPDESMLLPELADKLLVAGLDEQLEKEYYSQELRHIRDVASSKSAQQALDEISSLDLELNFNNLEAMISNRRDRRTGGLWEKTVDIGEKEVEEEQQRLVDALDGEDYEDVYKQSLLNISEKMSQVLMNDNDTFIDVRSISLIQKQLSVMSQSSESGSFDVPIEIDGQKISMHITLRSDKGMDSRMEASVQTYEYGLITATLFEKNGVVSGMLTTTNGQSSEETEYLESVRTKMCAKLAEKLKDIGVGQDKIAILYHAQSQPTSVGQTNANATDGNTKKITETKVFLTMAKAFIEAL